VPFHIEISSALNRARSFNVDEAEMRRAILEPWVTGLPFEFGGHEWQPRESRLAILSGPTLEAPTGKADQDWLTALRRGEDVTRRLLETAEEEAPEQVAMVIEADSLQAGLKRLRSGREQRPIEWAAALERLNSRDPDIAAVILVARRPD
jgi:hypothetical protein